MPHNHRRHKRKVGQIYAKTKLSLEARLQTPKLISFKILAKIVIQWIMLYNEKSKITSALELIKEIPQLILSYDGDSSGTDGTITALKACVAIITPETKDISKFTGKAKVAVNPVSIKKIIKALETKSKILVSPDTFTGKTERHEANSLYKKLPVSGSTQIRDPNSS